MRPVRSGLPLGRLAASVTGNVFGVVCRPARAAPLPCRRWLISGRTAPAPTGRRRHIAQRSGRFTCSRLVPAKPRSRRSGKAGAHMRRATHDTPLSVGGWGSVERIRQPSRSGSPLGTHTQPSEPNRSSIHTSTHTHARQSAA